MENRWTRYRSGEGLPDVYATIAENPAALRVSPDVLYVFYWGYRPGYTQYSPVVLIAERDRQSGRSGRCDPGRPKCRRND
jgi:hypothetical protein